MTKRYMISDFEKEIKKNVIKKEKRKPGCG